MHEPARVAALLDAWFTTHARDLPWRRRHDPYDVLLAEFILQQTRMETGLRYFAKIKQRFPTIQHLARAKPATVLALWSGLGYYARARNLHATARAIVRDHAARVPDNVATLKTLPGVGPYTAGAIASIAYDRPEPSLDGNQIRVLSRLLGTAATDKKRVEAFSRRVLRHASPRRLNQALMDLGSSVCTTETPSCDTCPLAPECKGEGTFAKSIRARPAETPVEHYDAWLHRRGDAVWLAAPPEAGLLAGLWNVPLRKRRTPGTATVEHKFSHKTWRIRVVRKRTWPSGNGRWVKLRELRRIPHARLTERLMRAGLADGPQ